jgi:hypothetical protein
MRLSALWLCAWCLFGCAADEAVPRPAPSYAQCDLFYQPGTDASRRCNVEVDKAFERQARSRSRVNCTPMADYMVCQ